MRTKNRFRQKLMDSVLEFERKTPAKGGKGKMGRSATWWQQPHGRAKGPWEQAE